LRWRVRRDLASALSRYPAVQGGEAAGQEKIDLEGLQALQTSRLASDHNVVSVSGKTCYNFWWIWVVALIVRKGVYDG
jgi:hypothetical protein